MRTMALLLALALSGCALGSTSTRSTDEAGLIIGEETLADFRGWPRETQLGYVLGFKGFGAAGGLVCERRQTIGELVAALKDRPFKTDRTVPSVLTELLKEQGCRMDDPENEA